jgi:hypothetical protein
VLNPSDPGDESWRRATFQIIKETASRHGVDPGWAVGRRVMFLQSEMRRLGDELDRLSILRLEDDSALAQALVDRWVDQLNEKIDNLHNELRRLREDERGKVREGQITDEMVERAREYPVKELVGFNRQGKATAWCHPDQNPSLHFMSRVGRAHCFVCDRSFDAIGVLMTRDGMSFADAVRELNR